MTNEELVNSIKEGIDITSCMEALYKQNKGIIHTIAKHYIKYSELDDLMQEGYLGLYDAVVHYDTLKTVKFITYATFWIRKSIQRYVENNCKIIRVSSEVHNLYNQYKKIICAYSREYNREPTDDELVALMNISCDRLNEIKRVMFSVDNVGSLEKGINNADDDISLVDTIDSMESVENTVIDKIINEDKRKTLWKIVEENIDSIEYDIIVKRYRKNMTFDELSINLGYNQAKVRRIENKALFKLKSLKVRRILEERYGLGLEERYEVVLADAYRGSVGSFNNTWTSSTERTAIKFLRIKNKNGLRC